MRLKRFNWYETRHNFNEPWAWKVRRLSLYYAVVNLRIQKTPIYTRAALNIYHCGDDSGEVHLFSYRTQKLSSLAPTILCWRRHGKIGSCCIQDKRKASINRWVLSFCVALRRMRQLPIHSLRERFAVWYSVKLPLRDLQIVYCISLYCWKRKICLLCRHYEPVVIIWHSKQIEW